MGRSWSSEGQPWLQSSPAPSPNGLQEGGVRKGIQEGGAGWGAAPCPPRAITHPSRRSWAQGSLLAAPQGSAPAQGLMMASAVPRVGVRHWEPEPAAHAAWGLDGCHRLHARPGMAAGASPAAQQGTRQASQGRKSCATTNAAAGWPWGGCRAAMGQPWAVMGEHIPGRGDVGLASPSPRGRDGGAVPVSGGAQASPQPEKQHLRSPGQSRSSAQRLGQAAVLLWARFRGQRPGLAGEEGRLGAQHAAGLAPQRPWLSHGAMGRCGPGGTVPWHPQPSMGTPSLPYLARRARSGRSSCGCNTSPRGCTRCHCGSSSHTSPRWHCRRGGSSQGSLQREMLRAATCPGSGVRTKGTRHRHQPPPASHPSPGPGAGISRGEPAVPVVGRRQVLTCPLSQHFSAPGQLWSERQYSLGGRGAPLPPAGHSPALPGTGRMAGGQRLRGARRGAGVTAGAVLRYPGLCCWARVGVSSANSARSARRRVRSPGIVLLSGSRAAGPTGWDLNPAGVGAGRTELLLPTAALYRDRGSAAHEQSSSGETPGAVLGSRPVADASSTARPFQVTGDPRAAGTGGRAALPEPQCLRCPLASRDGTQGSSVPSLVFNIHPVLPEEHRWSPPSTHGVRRAAAESCGAPACTHTAGRGEPAPGTGLCTVPCQRRGLWGCQSSGETACSGFRDWEQEQGGCKRAGVPGAL